MGKSDITLYDLLDAYEFTDLEDTFAKLYPKKFSKNVINYEKAFEKLKEISNVIENGCVINIEYVKEDDYTWNHVSGKHKDTPYDLDLTLTSWSEWLGMKFTEATLKHYNSKEIICHCIWEMTFFGYNEDTIQRTKDEFDKEVDDFINTDISAEAIFDEIEDIEDQNESRKILVEMLKEEIDSSSSDD